MADEVPVLVRTIDSDHFCPVVTLEGGHRPVQVENKAITDLLAYALEPTIDGGNITDAFRYIGDGLNRIAKALEARP